jgi:LCP family protein required for cell wall assembly
LKFFRIKRDKKRVEKKDKKITGKGKLNRFKRLPLYARIIIIIISSIIFVGAVGTAGFFIYIDSLNRAINSLNTTEIENILAPIESPEEPVTILVMGRDTRDAENDAGRADIIMLFYLDPEDNTGSLLSIPRDTLVEIPDHGEDKINAAYAYGGEELMIRTINSFLGAEINHYITLDFEGFVKLIDTLGGVDITIDRPIVDPKSGANFASGNHHLTGEQALSYTRSRSTELGDIGRIQRQQQLFKELVEQKLNIKYLSNVPYYFNILVENTRTDLDVLTILRYSKAILSFSSENFGTAIIPSRSGWIKEGTVSVQIPDVQEARAMWQRIINGEPAGIYNAEYSEVDEISDSMTINTLYKYKIRVKNTGALSWNKNGDNPIYLGYHWIDFNNKETVVFDGRRSIISEDGVNVGDEIVFDLVVISPSEPGEYILQVDLVQEGVTWFSFRGVPPLEKFVSIDLSYSAQYNDKGKTPNFLDTGEEFSAVIEVKNNGFLTWGFTGDERIALGTHWINRDTGEIITWDGNRGLLTHDISYGEKTEVEVNIKAPDKAGRYILQFDMVHERVTWFSEKGVIPLEVNIDVGRNLYKAVAKNTTVKIYNGNGISGAAGEIKAYLEKNGFKVLTISNAETFDFKETTILYNKGNLEKAEQLTLIFDNLEIYAYNNNWNFYETPADLIMIVGKDYKDIMQ